MPASSASATAQRATHIAGPDIAGETIVHIIGNFDRVSLVAERDCGEERPEHLLLRDAHFCVRADDQGRLHIVPAAGAVMRFAVDGNDRSVLPRHVEIRADLCEMSFVDQRPDLGCGIAGARPSALSRARRAFP